MDFVDYVVCVDDFCPENTGLNIEKSIQSERLQVIYHSKNMGVGGATKTGIKYAISIDADIIVKIDSDGFVEQMTKDPLPSFYGDYIGLCRLEGPLPKWKVKKYYEFDLIASSSFRVMEIYDQPYVNMNRQIDYLKALEIYED